MRIVNPLWFYIIGCASNIKIILSILAFLLLCGTTFSFAVKIEKHAKDGTFKSFFIWTAIVSILACAIPSEKTCYTMLAFDVLTVENVNTLGETGKDIIDYVFDKVDEHLDKN